MSTIQVDIVSAEGEIFSGEAAMVFASAREGDVGIAPRHAPLLTDLRPGDVRVQLPEGGEELHFYVSGGSLEIQPHLITVLADTVVRAADLDEAEAEEAMRRAQDALNDQAATIDWARAQAELAEAAARLRAIRRLRKQS
ncbi:MAG: F0F1 ATP synthase subunit epsilon [Pseudomonadota bacterium]